MITLQAASLPQASLLRRLGGWFVARVAQRAMRREARQTSASLGSLSDHQLRDIGVARDQIERTALRSAARRRGTSSL